jgi:hypothetical protein
MTIEESAHDIWSRFRHQAEHGWLMSIGIDQRADVPTIYIYTRHDIGQDRVLELIGPQEYPVMVEHSGQIYLTCGGPREDQG